MEKTITWLKELSEVPGVSGFEGPVKNLLKEKLAQCCAVSYDGIGSIVFSRETDAKAPKIMLAAHMDEIGFLVKHITKEGFLKFVTVGGWWEQVLLGQRVEVLTQNGPVPGVIGSKPPHILTPEERKKVVPKSEMYIDVGAQDEAQAREAFGIQPGDAVVPYSVFTVMANKKLLMGKAWDNRVGCAVMADVMRRLAERDVKGRVYGVGTVQEEVGLRGAQTASNLICPQIAFAIDTCVAGGTPGVEADKAPAKLGKGVAVTIYDASMLPHVGLRNFVLDLAKRRNILHQVAFTEGGGTDAGRIHLQGTGVPSLVLSIPTRYIHSHQSIISLDDYQSAVDLTLAIIEELNEGMYREIIEK